MREYVKGKGEKGESGKREGVIDECYNYLKKFERDIENDPTIEWFRIPFEDYEEMKRYYQGFWYIFQRKGDNWLSLRLSMNKEKMWIQLTRREYAE